MTLPITRPFPQVPDFEDLDEAKKYLHDLNFELQNSYQQTVQNVNGFFRNHLDKDGSEYIPTLEGSTTPGTFTYSRQSAYVLRQGLMTDVWFEVRWTAPVGATGQLRLNLPYKITNISPLFFVGSCYMNQAVFPPGATQVVILGITNSYQISFQASGTGIDTVAINVYGAALTCAVGGHIRYIGQEDE